jgi:hypothetical protein
VIAEIKSVGYLLRQAREELNDKKNKEAGHKISAAERKLKRLKGELKMLPQQIMLLEGKVAEFKIKVQ